MASIDHLLEIVNNDMALVEQQLSDTIASDITILGDICTHILNSGGKRLRPLMVLLTAKFCNYRGNKHIPLACAVEYIHTATLLHDDVIDHAEIRRGNSSANKLWGNQATILAGDYFLSKAFSLALTAHDLRILEIIAETSQCMAEAEIFQVAKAGDPLTTEEEYFFIVKNKTASLIAAAARIGGLLGGVSEKEQDFLEEYGFNLGIAFQIMDDVLDYNSSEKDFGKTIGKDLQEGSITLPFIAALQRSSAQDRQCMIQVVHKQERDKQDLVQIISLIDTYEGSLYAMQQARHYSQKAVDALSAFRDNENKEALVELARYIIERKF